MKNSAPIKAILERKEITKSAINMTALVKSVKEEKLTGNTNDIEFVIDTLLPAICDQTMIKQVWANLISNAIKYSINKPKIKIEIGSYYKDNLVVYYVKDNGAGFDMQIEIGSYYKDNLVVYYVKDNGVGFNMHYYNKLFGVFQRLHSSEEFEGTGIGLAIVQKIIHRHNGTVWAKSIPVPSNSSEECN